MLQWLEIEFASSIEIGVVYLTRRHDCCMEREQGVQLRVGFDPVPGKIAERRILGHNKANESFLIFFLCTKNLAPLGVWRDPFRALDRVDLRCGVLGDFDREIPDRSGRKSSVFHQGD